MKDIYEIITQIQSTSSRNDKESILAAQKDNHRLRLLLSNVFNPYVVFGVKDKKLNKFLKSAKGINSKFTTLWEVFDYLKENNTGTDAVVKEVAEFLMAEWDEDIRNLMYECITKKLRIGMTAKSINKALNEDLIPEFNVMLAKKFEDEQHKIKGEFVITEKLDGMRAILYVEGDSVKAFSRQGQPILGLIEVAEHAKHLPDGVYDGELLIHNADDYKDRDVLQETLKIARKDGDKIGLVYHCFDMLPIKEFHSGKSSKKYFNRREELEFILQELRSPFIKMLPVIYKGNDLSIIPALLDQMDSEGKEGLMLNTNSYYETKRSSNLLKIKTMQSFDEVCLEVIEGDGKYKGKLGAIVVNYKGFPLSIGSGFTDEQRDFYWKNPDEIVTRVVEIQYFRESKNANGGLSVSFPVFKMVRENGKEVSYN